MNSILESKIRKYLQLSQSIFDEINVFKENDNLVTIDRNEKIKIILDCLDVVSKLHSERLSRDKRIKDVKSLTIDRIAKLKELEGYLIAYDSEYGIRSRSTPDQLIPKFIEVKEIPDDFYSDLILQINRAFYFELYPLIPFLIRKLFENLLIDILRKKFSMTQVDLFFDKTRRRFHDFAYLIKQLSERLNEFQANISGLDRKFIKKLEKYRLQGNASAHSITLDITKDEILRDKKEITYITKFLFRLLGNIT